MRCIIRWTFDPGRSQNQLQAQLFERRGKAAPLWQKKKNTLPMIFMPKPQSTKNGTSQKNLPAWDFKQVKHNQFNKRRKKGALLTWHPSWTSAISNTPRNISKHRRRESLLREGNVKSDGGPQHHPGAVARVWRQRK